MAKSKAKFVCQNCGTSHAKWAGRCENCGEWNTLLEQEMPTEAEAKSALARGAVSGKKLAAVSINQIEPSDAGSRLKTGFPELDNVLGGGILLGGVALLAGQVSLFVLLPVLTYQKLNLSKYQIFPKFLSYVFLVVSTMLARCRLMNICNRNTRTQSSR